MGGNIEDRSKKEKIVYFEGGDFVKEGKNKYKCFHTYGKIT